MIDVGGKAVPIDMGNKNSLIFHVISTLIKIGYNVCTNLTALF